MHRLPRNSVLVWRNNAATAENVGRFPQISSKKNQHTSQREFGEDVSRVRAVIWKEEFLCNIDF
jgi:hypothetical protein